MGGKGLRRRQKNYKEAHGGRLNRLPPPPDPSKVDALPSSLRKLISLTSPIPSQDHAKDSKDVKKKTNVGADDASEPKSRPKDEAAIDNPAVKDSTRQASGVEDLNWEMSQFGDDADNNVKSSENEHKKKRKKRKRGQVEDLRFAESLKNTAYGSKKREKKKKYLEAKKNKLKKGKTESTLDFPRDKVEFGEIVQAPPKLVQVPKASKTRKYSASQERVRLKAVEDYRKRKGWTSRPGLHLPTSVTAPSV